MGLGNSSLVEQVSGSLQAPSSAIWGLREGSVVRRAPSRNSQTPRRAAWACPDKLGFSLASSLALRTLISLSFGAQVSPRTEAFGDVATWVWAAQADRTLVGDMLKIGGRQSWYFRHGF